MALLEGVVVVGGPAGSAAAITAAGAGLFLACWGAPDRP
jgi:thioredoxin reductase